MAAIGKIVALDFEPNLTYHYKQTFWGAANFTTYLEGSLTPYAELIDPNQGGGAREVEVVLRLPEALDKPGTWTLFVCAVDESQSAQGGVGVRAAIQSPIYVKVPYPGYYVELRLRMPFVAENETATAFLDIDNRGSNNLTDMRVELKLLDWENKTVFSLVKKLSDALPSKQKRTEEFKIETMGIMPGDFTANATLFYHGQKSSASTKFKIGSRDIWVISYPKQLPPNKISKFPIVVEARWGPELNVFSEISLDGSKLSTTPSVKLGGFSRANLEGFVDTTGFSEGEHNLSLKFFFGDNSKVVNDRLEIVSQRQQPSLESPKPNTMVIAILIIAAIATCVAVGLLLFILLRKNEKK